jgi:hypothetical protein
MRKVLVVALGALALAGCVHHDGGRRGAAYGGYGHGYGFGGYRYHPAQTVPMRPAFWPADHRRDWRDGWRGRRHPGEAWWHGG